MRYCPKCSQDKPKEDFNKDRNRSSGLQCWCRECGSSANRDNHRKYGRPDKTYTTQRDYALRHHYGLSLEVYNDMLEQQDYRCAICARRKEDIGSGKLSFSVDHNHITGAVRGLLCGPCNTGIGSLQGDEGIEMLQNAISYLRDTTL